MQTPPGGDAKRLKATLARARQLSESGQAEAALKELRREQQYFPDAPQLLAAVGSLAAKTGALTLAEETMRHLAAVRPSDAASHIHLGGVLFRASKYEAARAAYAEAVRVNPSAAVACYNLGRCESILGNIDAAVQAYREAKRLRPNFIEADFNLGATLLRLGEYEEAEKVFERLVQANPQHVDLQVQLARVLQSQGRRREAAIRYREILDRTPERPDAQVSLALCLIQDNEIAPAAELIERAERSEQVRASELKLARAWLSAASGDKRRAVQLLTEVASSDSGSVSQFVLLTEWLADLRRRDKAVEILDAGVKRFPSSRHLRVLLLINERHSCDWRDRAGASDRIADWIDGASPPPISPFAAMSIPGVTADALRRLARQYSSRFIEQGVEPGRFSPVAISTDERPLRIGYLSADFHEHATAYLAASVFEHHHHDRVETIAYSFGPDDQSPTRRRLERAFTGFRDIRNAAHDHAAQQIRDDRIDILVDLKGYTRDARPQILAARPAPIQVSWLGYPGTMGAPFVDYLIADPVVLPASDTGYFDEAIAYMPHTYAPVDTFREVAETPSRASLGLPEQAFVLCCFNNARKISAEVFDRWCSVLDRFPGSVLWFLAERESVAENLRAEACSRGIDPERLVPAPTVRQPEHLARIKVADLVLDTLPYNAHTTASDALWMGVPIVTCRGSLFQSRVAASLLNVVGLAELVTEDLDQYEERVVMMITDPAVRADVRRRLAEAREWSPYFDNERFARDLEQLYERMWSRFTRGEAPATLR